MLPLLLTITALKLIVASLWGGTADIPQTLNQATAFLAGQDVLDPASTGGNPSFFPLGHYLIAATCLVVSQWTAMPFAFVIKLPSILADLGVALLLRTMPRGGQPAALLYLANPLTVLLSAYHGQLHTVAMALAVLALWLVDRGWVGLSGLLLGLAASVRQHYAILMVPLAMRAGTRRIAALATFAVAVVALNTLLLGSAHLDRLLKPTWTYGSWGYTMLLLQGPRVLDVLGIHGAPSAMAGLNHALRTFGPVVMWIWTTLFMVWLFAQQARGTVDLWRSTLVFLVGLYAVSPGFGVQWLVWALPFWLVVNPRGALWYSTLAGAFLLGSYWQWGLNAKYGLGSLTANLTVLSRGDLGGVLLVGALGVVTWAYCVGAAWRLAKA